MSFIEASLLGQRPVIVCQSCRVSPRGSFSIRHSASSIIVGRGNYLVPGIVRLVNITRGAQQLVDSLRSLLPDVDERLNYAAARIRTTVLSNAISPPISQYPPWASTERYQSENRCSRSLN